MAAEVGDSAVLRPNKMGAVRTNADRLRSTWGPESTGRMTGEGQGSEEALNTVI